MRLLALDCGTRTGWATWDGRLESGVQTFELRRGESPGMRFLFFTNWLRSLLSVFKPELVVYELAHHRGGPATEVGVGLMTRVQEACAAAGLTYTGVHTATLKKWVTGSGRAGKPDMFKAVATRWGVAPLDDNEADAIALVMYARWTYAPEEA